MRKTSKRRIGLLGLIICLLLTACGGNDAVSQQGEDISAVQSGEAAPETEQLVGGIAQAANPLHVEKVQTVQFREPEEGYTEHSASYKVLGEKIYMFRIENTEEDWGLRLCVQIYDAETQKTEQLYMVPEIPEHENARLVSADLTAGMELSLKMRDGETDDSFFLVRTNLNGDVLQVADPFPEEVSYPWNKYLWDDVKAFDLSDGRTILCRSNAEEETTTLTWYREDTGDEERLAVLSDGFIRSIMLDEEGIFYYLNGGSVIRWDLQKNVSEELFRLYENGIEAGVKECGLIRNKEGELLLCCIQSGKATIYVLTDKESPDKEKIQLCSLLGAAGVSYFQRVAATFTQNGGEIPISMTMEERQEYWEDYRTRILAEMMTGEGPDVLYVSREDMILMQEKGMLCELSDMIDQETKEVLIPGALGLGTVNGELVGLVPEVSFITLGTGNKVWAENGWNAEDLISVLKTDGGWEYPFEEMGCQLSGGVILFYVFFMDPAKSDFLDLEQGTARFDSEEFINILELCKKYGDQRTFEEKMKEQLSLEERTRLMREGQIVAEIKRLYGGLDSFSDIAERYGDEAHVVGFPVESGSGHYVDSYSYGYLVVNANTRYREEISKFFAQLLDYDNQFKTIGGCVRMDVIRDSVYYDERSGDYYMLRSSDTENRSLQQIALKPDGTPYLEEYLAFVEGCEPQPYWPEQIRAIVSEETALYFEGSRSAKDTADIIQNRVQVYLDENR